MASTSGLIRTFVQGAPVNPRRFVKLDANGDIVQCGAADPAMLGVSDQVGKAETGQRVDVRLTGTAEIEAGAPFAADARLTSDAEGKAVAAVSGEMAMPAMTDAEAAGDFSEVFLALHTAV